jgi:hypothetical protein
MPGTLIPIGAVVAEQQRQDAMRESEERATRLATLLLLHQ